MGAVAEAEQDPLRDAALGEKRLRSSASAPPDSAADQDRTAASGSTSRARRKVLPSGR